MTDEQQPQFTADELSLIRQWFEVVQNVTPEYLEDRDRKLAAKIFKLSPLRVARLEPGTAEESGSSHQKGL